MLSLWSDTLRVLSTRLPAQNLDLWLPLIECRAIEGDRILLRAPNQYVGTWFESHYLPLVLEELRSRDGHDYRIEIEISPASKDSAPASATPLASTDGASMSAAPMSSSASSSMIGGSLGVSSAPGARPYIEMPGGPMTNAASLPERSTSTAETPALNPKYTFDTFVVGPSNQLAHAAARAVSSMDQPKYNPLFLCGGAGLGKTHLLHAIGHHVLTQRPSTRIIYCSGERFVNDFIASIRTNRMPEFRKRYREDCDLLLLDDIQFIANKDSTQEEFFHTFNSLHEQQRQIVLSADRKPIEIPDIADRLRTRFSMGLIADIEPPEMEVRVAILRKKAAAENIPLPDEVSLYVAEAIKSNVRELEGALIRLSAYASLSNTPITMEFARETLAGVIATPSEHLSVELVQKTVASYFQVKLADLKSERRHKSIAHPRAVAMYLARKHTGESYPDLGRGFGNKHHTTVLAACEKISTRMKTDLGLRNQLRAIENLLGR